MYNEKELRELELIELKRKRDFVDGLGKTLVKYDHSIVKVEYDVFTNKEFKDEIFEYLVFHWKGGGKSVVNCRCNSLSAILREMGDKIDGGYYKEIDTYDKLKKGATPFFISKNNEKEKDIQTR